MPRWLDAEEQAAWRALLEATSRLFDELERRLQREAGLSHADYEVLVRLSEAPGRRMRMSELAEQALVSRSRLSHAVNRLEARGLLQREACDTDRRGTYAVLTDEGFARLEQIAPAHVEDVRRLLFDHLTAGQVHALGEIYRAVIDGRRGASGRSGG
ncbi:MAG TPA: MarR family transcriptional regulator [Acidimicrobiales bacterium]|jgi:DNA-binding MarR family transcriptional regulator|nr:MarR family transcriptional regulator [Acidimicrobiales bacterium]